MRATAFPYYTPPFAEYNVAQRAVVPFLDKDVNLVISFATAVGKTVLGECCFAYHLSDSESDRVAYVCPYRSLASEKEVSWKENSQLSPYGLVLSTGDTKVGIDELTAGRIAIVTSESFDAKSRLSNYRDWFRSLACVVFDEAHLIGDDGRGGAVEAALMRFTLLNPRARIVLLSATMGNATELAKWIKSLNGKPTKCITSEWRPSKVEIDYCVIDGNDEKISESCRLAEESSGKTVVFVHSKVIGKEITRRLKSSGHRCAFHNASVPNRTRKKIESAFNDRMSGLNIIVSTSTLAAGVNIG